MAYEDKSEDSSDLYEEIMERWNKCEEFYSNSYKNGEDDQEFLYGVGQWDADSVNSRKRDNRPVLVFNQLLPFAHQVINDIKQARPAIRVSPVDDRGDIETAEVFQGIIRNIERQSKANVAYDTAAMNSVGAGLGWVRVTTDYSDPMSFDQEIKIERIINFQSVYADPESTELDGSDMEYCFVFDVLSKDDFEREYPDANTDSFNVSTNEWYTGDEVRVAEYFYKTYDKRTIYDTDVGIFTKQELELLEEQDIPVEVNDERETQFPVVKWCKVNGDEIIEKGEWAGKDIPIVPVFGEEVWLDGKREFHSLIRQAKDAQRAYNYWKTASTELIALQQKAPFIAPVGSFASYPDEWSNANNINYATLEYDVVYDEQNMRVEPPQRQPPVMGSPTMLQEAAGASQDVRNALGMHEASMGQQGNEISGIAVRNRQLYGDNANFHFMDNLSASITQVGCILVDLIPKLYSKKMITRIIGEDGTEENVPINQPFVKDENGKRPVKEGEQYDGVYDLKAGKYDVVCDVGASYSSKRQEMSDKLMELFKVAPQLAEVSSDIAVEALDLPMSKELAERIRSQMPPELLGDDPQAAKLQEAAGALKEMQEKLLNYEAALEDKEKNTKFEQAAKSEELQLDRDKFKVDAEKTQADIAKIYADIEGEQASTAEQSMDNIAAITQQVGELSQTVELILADMEEDFNEQETLVPEEIEEQAIESELNE